MVSIGTSRKTGDWRGVKKVESEEGKE